MSDMKDAKLEKKARQAAEGAVATREYYAERDAKIARMASLKAKRIARDAAKQAHAPAPEKRR